MGAWVDYKRNDAGLRHYGASHLETHRFAFGYDVLTLRSAGVGVTRLRDCQQEHDPERRKHEKLEGSQT